MSIKRNRHEAGGKFLPFSGSSSSCLPNFSCHISRTMPPVSNRVPSKFHDSELICDDAWRLPVCTHLYSSPWAGGCELWISGVGSKMQTLSS